jgi:hypothetical protein
MLNKATIYGTNALAEFWNSSYMEYMFSYFRKNVFQISSGDMERGQEQWSYTSKFTPINM